ncbi:nuclear transport factor 2 family protein [uncultured Tateyamaria sp.]|uniref:nuclear transport factor 2 family protein n=1 Tax=uncultured Tateyamaria sp. TaxID=455651 RepID=UPI0026240D9D|nr:nuclear transport factor 2 family protein [uncultured Tateyamaria sp.]
MAKNYRHTLLRSLSLAACLTLALGVPATAAEDSAVEETNRQIVDDAFKGWKAGTINVFDLLADDVIWTITGFNPMVSGTYYGKEDLLSRTVEPFSERMSEGLSPTVHSVWADGEDVIIHFDGEGRTAADDVYRNSYLWVFKMDDGVVTEVTAFLDTAAFAALLSRDPD